MMDSNDARQHQGKVWLLCAYAEQYVSDSYDLTTVNCEINDRCLYGI
jgi:hypothetical protein